MVTVFFYCLHTRCWWSCSASFQAEAVSPPTS